LRLRESSKGNKSLPSPYRPEYVRGMSLELSRGLGGGESRGVGDRYGTVERGMLKYSKAFLLRQGRRQ
jgi:hypothetical protein